MQKILFICNDVLGKIMAGPGIRCWEMAHALGQEGHEVAVLARHIESGFFKSAPVSTGKASLINLLTYILHSDCVIMPGRPISILLAVLFRKKLIFDQYDPVIFEFLERRPVDLAGKIQKMFMLLLWKIRQRIILRFGGGFLVANDKQKDFLIGQMAILGHTQKLDSITVLPFGLPNGEPVKSRPVLRGTKIKDKDFLLVWGGGIWDWFDPFTLLSALATIKQKRDDIKAYFPGLRPPSPDSQAMAVVENFLAEAARLELLDNTVFINTDWTPYDERADYLLEADAGISLHKDSMETRFAFRTRMLDYLWAGLPIIASQGDSWSVTIEKQGMGITVKPGDVDAVVDAIVKMADDKTFREKCGKQASIAAGSYTWSALVKRLPIS